MNPETEQETAIAANVVSRHRLIASRCRGHERTTRNRGGPLGFIEKCPRASLVRRTGIVPLASEYVVIFEYNCRACRGTITVSVERAERG